MRTRRGWPRALKRAGKRWLIAILVGYCQVRLSGLWDGLGDAKGQPKRPNLSTPFFAHFVRTIDGVL